MGDPNTLNSRILIFIDPKIRLSQILSRFLRFYRVSIGFCLFKGLGLNPKP